MQTTLSPGWQEIDKVTNPIDFYFEEAHLSESFTQDRNEILM